MFYFKALQLGDLSRVVPLDKLSVVITMAIAFIFFKEQVSLRVVVGGLLIVGGSILICIK